MNSSSATLLIEIGTEELPPLALRRLSETLGKEIRTNLDTVHLDYGEVSCFATPRRLAVLIADVQTEQAEREQIRRGPALKAAFDSEGNPTKAALGFARSCGISVEELEQDTGAEGGRLLFRKTEPGQPTTSLLSAIVSEALPRLPVPKRMRWADLAVEFARPVHWVVLLFGEETITTELMGVTSDRITHGHRFHCPTPLVIPDPTDYVRLLREEGHVLVDFDLRKDMIREQVQKAAQELGGQAIVSDELLEEVTALVEWPVAIAGSFDEEFLELPDKVLMGTMSGHQRYFPVQDQQGNLMPHFITVSNIESRNPDVVRSGNERVIRPRLADAAFFFDADLRHPLADHLEGLRSVVFQKKLGSLFDKSQRVSRLAQRIAETLANSLGDATDKEVAQATRAGLLCKCDLLTQVVGELPELQGYLGRVYGERTGEEAEIAQALEEVYWPRFAGDRIPTSRIGQAVAIADKLDSLVGIFGIGQIPKGDRDPFALRRAALGTLRILIEGKLDLSLPQLLNLATEGYGTLFNAEEVTPKVLGFMIERLRGYFAEQGIAHDVFTAVAARNPDRPLDFTKRVHAVAAFQKLPEAMSLAAANKRIQNILRQADFAISDQVKGSLLEEEAERDLAARVADLAPEVRQLLFQGDYTAAMRQLAGLRDSVDGFFDAVLVMAEDQQVKNNRFALLQSIHDLFSETADISCLAG